MIFVALRSTGPDAARDRVVHFAAAAINPSVPPKAFNSYVNPGDNLITEGLEAALGINVGALRNQRTIGAVLESFFRFCESMRGGRPVVLVGHNAHHFQWPLLTHELRRARIQIPSHFDLWDSLHAVRPFYEKRRLSSCRPRDILQAWGYPLPAANSAGDIQAVVVVLESLSRIGQPSPQAGAPARIYGLLEFTNKPYIEAQQRNPSNQFGTCRLQVNAAEKPTPSPAPEGLPTYDPDFIPDLVSQPEPPPAPEGLEVYDRLCRWVNHFYPDKNQEVLDFAELLQARHNYGKQKYKQPLMTGDGRDDLEDARQELGDLAMYACKALMNHRDVGELQAALKIVEALLGEKEFFEDPESVSETPELSDDDDNDDPANVGDTAEKSTGGHSPAH